MSTPEPVTALPPWMQAFERAAREHLLHPPSEWTVVRRDTRRWDVVDHRGATMATRTTRKAARAAIDDSTERRIWEDNRAWYLGESTDPRARQLTADEQLIVAAILAERTETEAPSA
ncbi:hypothetical protein [Nocardia asteroides]|uniref:hypothetical protein n=1 Tax=Nocardia asteroides TaxID=1824 RepID=UPI001E60E75E|nr:hypothetical protein [Nocardia asteroides]UGT58847.1 hypothetical protein LTT85_33385 [Nocardia asteroides]